jgi:hypothetical protein
MRSKLIHIAHGTAAVREEKPLRYRRKQLKLETRAQKILNAAWIKELETDHSLDKAKG